MGIVSEPDEYEVEVLIDDIDQDNQPEQDHLVRHDGEVREVKVIKSVCKTCDKQRCFDNYWHAGHIMYPHIAEGAIMDYNEEPCEVVESVLLGKQVDPDNEPDQVHV